MTEEQREKERKEAERRKAEEEQQQKLALEQQRKREERVAKEAEAREIAVCPVAGVLRSFKTYSASNLPIAWSLGGADQHWGLWVHLLSLLSPNPVTLPLKSRQPSPFTAPNVVIGVEDDLQSKCAAAMRSAHKILGQPGQPLPQFQPHELAGYLTRLDGGELQYRFDSLLSFFVFKALGYWQEDNSEKPMNYDKIMKPHDRGQHLFLHAYSLRHLLASSATLQRHYHALLFLFVPDLVGKTEEERDKRLLVAVGEGGTLTLEGMKKERGFMSDHWKAFAQGLALLHACVLVKEPEGNLPHEQRDALFPFSNVWTLLVRWGVEGEGESSQQQGAGELSRSYTASRLYSLAALLIICAWRLRQDYGKDPAMRVLGVLQRQLGKVDFKLRDSLQNKKDDLPHKLKRALQMEDGVPYVLKAVPGFPKRKEWWDAVQNYHVLD